MSDTFQYDVFLSHSAKDKAVVRDVAERLQKDGLKVWFDAWVLKPGDSIPAKIEEGLERSRVLVLCMSANAFGSDWAQLEAGTFRFRDPMNKQRRFIPLRLDDAALKGSLAQFHYINWLPSLTDEYVRLLEACRSPDPTDSQTGEKNRCSHGSQIMLDVSSNSILHRGTMLCELCVKATNMGQQTFDWSGLTVSIPCLDSKELYRAAEFDMTAKGSMASPPRGPADFIWCFSDGDQEQRPAKHAHIESITNLWEPRRTIELRAAFKVVHSPIIVGFRAWANPNGSGWTNSVIGEPLWASAERRDQQGIPAFWRWIGE